MLRFILVFVFIFGLSQSLTTKSSINDDSHIGRILAFDSENKMTCFYEPLEVGMVLNIAMRPTFDSQFPMQFRVTSPSGEFSDWASGDGEAHMSHNTTENGAYEICSYTRRPMRINLLLQFFSPEKMEHNMKEYLNKHELSAAIQTSVMGATHRIYKIYYTLKFQNQMVVRDEALQEINAEYIQNYSIIFSIFAIVISISQVYYVRKLFRIDPTRIRI